MQADMELCSLSYFVLSGDYQTINIIDSSDTGDYEWILYIMRGSYDKVFGEKIAPTIDSELLHYLIDNPTTKFGVRNKPFCNKKLLCLKGSVNYREHVAPDIMNFLNTDSAGPLVISSEAEHLLTPFTGVGTSFPPSKSPGDIANLIAVCTAPCNTHGVLVGNTEMAKNLLGEGLVHTREVLFNYLEVTRSPQSVPLDIAIPIIYSEYLDNPSMLEIVENQTIGIGDIGTKWSYMLYSVVMTSCAMYSILETDHGYRGLAVIDSPIYPRYWSIETTSTSTRVPYRYPALVHLLSCLDTTEAATSAVEYQDIAELLKSWGKDSLLTQLSDLQNSADTKMSLFSKLPTICKSFFIKLYRITCKDTITMPCSKVYPRRSDASKLFLGVYKRYSSTKTLGDYLQLGDLILQSSVLQQRERLSSLCDLMKLKPYDIVNDPGGIPPIAVKGSIAKDTLPNLWSWKSYSARMGLWGDRLLETEAGELISVKSIIGKATNDLLEDLLVLSNTDRFYKIVDTNSLKRMTEYYGFYDQVLSQEKISNKMTHKVRFITSPIEFFTLEDIIEYHINMAHPATEKIISMIIQILSVDLISIYTADGSPPNFSIGGYEQNCGKLAAKQYLQTLLDSSRI